MEDIKDILSELTGTKLKHGMEGVKLLEQWEDLAGKRLSALSEPAYIRNDVLFVFVKNSTALQEILYNKSILLKNINTKKELPFVKDIKCTIRAQQEP
ncbi:MAG: DUF721 domain-containing protein [Deltaproteobacteria bacterium]|nr:DUF721 domain-containing protein [Deltaproteobacteria bacterium]